MSDVRHDMTAARQAQSSHSASMMQNLNTQYIWMRGINGGRAKTMTDDYDCSTEGHDFWANSPVCWLCNAENEDWEPSEAQLQQWFGAR